MIGDEDYEPRRQSNDRFTASFRRPARRLSKKGLTKEQIEEKSGKSQAFIRKKVIAGGRLGTGVRVDHKGSLVVRHLTSEAAYDPDAVRIAGD
jgi:hypothetical protein